MKRAGQTAGKDFEDNRVPGRDKKSLEEIDHRAEIRQPTSNGVPKIRLFEIT